MEVTQFLKGRILNLRKVNAFVMSDSLSGSVTAEQNAVLKSTDLVSPKLNFQWSMLLIPT